MEQLKRLVRHLREYATLLQWRASKDKYTLIGERLISCLQAYALGSYILALICRCLIESNSDVTINHLEHIFITTQAITI
jgi:hypothetical protein